MIRRSNACSWSSPALPVACIRRPCALALSVNAFLDCSRHVQIWNQRIVLLRTRCFHHRPGARGLCTLIIKGSHTSLLRRKFLHARNYSTINKTDLLGWSSSLGSCATRRRHGRYGGPVCRPGHRGRLDQISGDVLSVASSLADKLLSLARPQVIQDFLDLLHLRRDRLVRLAAIAWLPQRPNDPQFTDPSREGK